MRLTTTLLALFLFASTTQAVEMRLPGPELQQKVQGTLVLADGEVLRFALPSGEALVLRDGDRELALMPVIENGEVRFRLLEGVGDVSDWTALDSLRLRLGEEGTLFGESGIRVQFEGMTQELRGHFVEPEELACGSCSLECGRLEATCTVCNGWCCEMTCSSGGSCSACGAVEAD